MVSLLKDLPNCYVFSNLLMNLDFVVQVEIVGEQAPLITKLSPSKENGDVIIDMSLSSENLPKVRT